jgi:hypothetical protein
VSSATTTVFVLTEVLAIVVGIGTTHHGRYPALQTCARSRYTFDLPPLRDSK